MNAVDVNITIVDGYLKLLENLSTENKLDIISKLMQSIKTDFIDNKKSFKKSFGAFESEKSAEDIIQEIRDSRTFNRQIESLSSLDIDT